MTTAQRDGGSVSAGANASVGYRTVCIKGSAEAVDAACKLVRSIIDSAIKG
jgi:hypothetical protein